MASKRSSDNTSGLAMPIRVRPYAQPARWRSTAGPTGLILAAAGVAFCLGCGNGTRTYPVEGAVRFDDGQPVAFGSVEFRHQDEGWTARGRIDPDGRFVLRTFETADGAPAGNYEVLVFQHLGDLPRHPAGDGTRNARPQHQADAEPIRLVAPRFARYESSGLRVEVKPQPDNRFELTVSAAAPSERNRR